MNYSPPSRQSGSNRPDRSGLSVQDQSLGPRVVLDPGPAAPEPEAPSIDFVNLLVSLWRRRLIILLVLAIGLTIGFLTVFREVPMYRATATMEVQARDIPIIQGQSVDPGMSSDADFIGTQLALLKSRALAERVADALELDRDPAYSNPSAPPETRLGQAASGVMQGLSVAHVRGARIIQVTYTSTRPADTARIANAVSDQFIQMNLERRYNATAYARQFLEERLETTKVALEETERRLVDYSKEQQILDLSSVGGSDIGSSLDASALVSINASLTEAQNARMIAEQRYREAVDNPNTIELVQNERLQSLRSQRSNLLADYQQKLNTYKPDFPSMMDLAARIDAIEAAIVTEQQNYVSALETAWRASLTREQTLQTRVGELRNQVLDLRGRSIDYNILRREADTLRAQYDALLQRFKEVSIVSGVGSSPVTILDAAQTPGMPFSPNIPAELLRALMLSLAVAIALALLVEFVDDRIKTPEDITRKLGLRILGVIPKYRSRQPITNVLSDPRSPVTEAFASTRAAVQFIASAGGYTSILVTAGKSGEGKTSCSLALATAFAAVGKRVLIIDADMRRPSFAYNSDESAGLSGVLADNAVLMTQVIAGPAQNLFLLPAGKPPPNPAELLGSMRVVQLIEEASNQFDLVVIDSPPAQAFADAQSLSAVCDATILVLQSAGSHRQTARRTLDRLRAANAEIIGCILTKFDTKRYGYGTSYGYGYEDYAALSRRRVRSASEQRRQIGYFRNDAPPKEDLFD